MKLGEIGRKIKKKYEVDNTNDLKEIQERLYISKGEDRVCNFFGRGKTLTLEERRARDYCIEHSGLT